MRWLTDGIRSAMLKAYKKHRALAKAQGSRGSSAHEHGLYGALSTRNMVSGKKFDHFSVTAELFPFLSMDETDSVSALAEYAVYRELPQEIEPEALQRLSDAVNRVVEKQMSTEQTAQPLVAITGIHRVTLPWLSLLETGNRERLLTAASSASHEFNSLDGDDGLIDRMLYYNLIDRSTTELKGNVRRVVSEVGREREHLQGGLPAEQLGMLLYQQMFEPLLGRMESVFLHGPPSLQATRELSILLCFLFDLALYQSKEDRIRLHVLNSFDDEWKRSHRLSSDNAFQRQFQSGQKSYAQAFQQDWKGPKEETVLTKVSDLFLKRSGLLRMQIRPREDTRIVFCIIDAAFKSLHGCIRELVAEWLDQGTIE